MSQKEKIAYLSEKNSIQIGENFSLVNRHPGFYEREEGVSHREFLWWVFELCNEAFSLTAFRHFQLLLVGVANLSALLPYAPLTKMPPLQNRKITIWRKSNHISNFSIS